MSLIAPERLTSESNDYKKFLLHNPSYVRTKVLPQSGSQTVTMTPTGTQETYFELTARPFNLYRSYLQFLLDVPDTNIAGQINWHWEHTLSQIQQIQLLTRQNQYIVDINNLQNYLATVWPKELPIKDAQSMSPEVEYPSISISEPQRHDGSRAVYYANEFRYLFEANASVAGGTNDVGSVYRQVNFPLRLILNSVFGVDHDLYLGGDVCLLHIIWGNGSKVAFFNTAAGSPAGGTPTIQGNNITLTNVTLQLAMQTNIHLQNELISKVQSGSFSMYVPYIYSFKQNLAGTSQSVTQRFTRGHGHVLKKILHAPFNNTENANTAYDHDNRTIYDAANAVLVPPKVVSYYTMLDQNREQAYDVQCQGEINPAGIAANPNLIMNNIDDWLLHREMLQGSVAGSLLDVYRYNWFHCSDYSGFPSKIEKPLPVPDGNVESGLSLERDRIWTIQMTMTNDNYNHYTWAMTQKLMTIGGGDRGPVLVQ